MQHKSVTMPHSSLRDISLWDSNIDSESVDDIVIEIVRVHLSSVLACNHIHTMHVSYVSVCTM